MPAQGRPSRPLPGMAALAPPKAARSRQAGSGSKLEATLATQLRALHLPLPVREATFHPTRKWRFDFSWPDRKLAVEVEGGIWTQGRHNRGAGFAGDVAKLNEATLMGWRVLRVTDRMIKDQSALVAIVRALRAFPPL